MLESLDGTCARERYSAKRIADRRSTAQLRMARNARPDGCGRRAPRSNQALIPARSNAFSSRPRYSRGERRNTAISSKRTPARASSRMRRAISTHSRPSPGAENRRTSPRARAFSGLPRREERAPKRCEVGLARRHQRSDFGTQAFEIAERPKVSERYGDQAFLAPRRSNAPRGRTPPPSRAARRAGGAAGRPRRRCPRTRR